MIAWILSALSIGPVVIGLVALAIYSALYEPEGYVMATIFSVWAVMIVISVYLLATKNHSNNTRS
jgi:hypothetical protein